MFESMWALLGSTLLTLTFPEPAAQSRWKLTPLISAALIVLIIAAGAFLIYFIVLAPGPTTTTYP